MVKGKYLDKTIFLVTGIFVFLLPLDLKILSPLIGLITILAIIRSNKSEVISNIQLYKSSFIFFILLFVWQLISVAWSTDMSNGMEAIEHRVFYLIAPLLFFLVKKWPSNKLIKTFILSNFLICVFCFCYLIYFFIDQKMYFIEKTINEGITAQTFRYITYHSGANFIVFDVHRLYFSFSLLSSLLFLHFKGKVIRNNLFRYLVASMFTLVIFMLQSKIAIILLVVLLFYITYKKFTQSNTKKRAIILFVFMVIMSLGFYLTKIRFYQSVKQIGTITENKEGSLTERFQYARCSLELIGEAPFFGYGIGDINHVVKEKLIKYNYTTLLERGVYDPHNEFLKTYIGTGIIGFLLFLGIFVSVFRKAYYDKNFLLLVYIGFVLIICLIEPFLSRQAGILPVLFFIGLLTDKAKNTLSM